jgi:hypothetical protein
MAYRDDDEALAAEASELRRELDSVLAKCALPPSSTSQLAMGDHEPAEQARNGLREEVASLREQLGEARSDLAALRGASNKPPSKGRRGLRLNDPFELSPAHPASLPTPPASGWKPLSCVAALVLLAVAMLVCVYLLFAMIGYGFLG